MSVEGLDNYSIFDNALENNVNYPVKDKPVGALRTGPGPDPLLAGNPHVPEGKAGMTHESPHWQQTDRNYMMGSGERVRGNRVVNEILSHDKEIQDAAVKHGIDPDLIKATIYEEQTHLMPTESFQESYLGQGNTVGLGQMTVGNHGYNRQQLLQPEHNIDAIAQHYSNMDQTMSVQQMARTYNGSGPKAEMYGNRVENYHREFQKLSNP